MGEFEKPMPVKVEFPEWLLEFYKRTLQKDIQKHEGICPYCHGVGWEISDQIHGLSDDPDKGCVQYIIPCRHCYTGIIHYCEHCGKELSEGRLKCNCATVKQEENAKAAKKEAERLDAAEKLPADALGDKFDMCYSECYGHNEGYFSDWESFFEEWCDSAKDEHDGIEPERPKYVWGTNEMMICAGFLRFPVRAGEPDKNGNIYTEEAVAKACVGASGQPIIQCDEHGEEIPVGVANKVWFEDGHINVEGMAWFGGTCEKVKFDNLNRISDMTITSFSICG